jgi:hypothetical protein
MCRVLTQINYYVKTFEYIHGILLKFGNKDKQYGGREREATPCFLSFSLIACFLAPRRYVPAYLTFGACRLSYGSCGGRGGGTGGLRVSEAKKCTCLKMSI